MRFLEKHFERDLYKIFSYKYTPVKNNFFITSSSCNRVSLHKYRHFLADRQGVIEYRAESLLDSLIR